VQVRRNAWDLAGFEGNRRGRSTGRPTRVTAVRGDGGLDVVTAGGEPKALPAGYVAEHLALGYAATVHAAQGSTVDTTHSVITADSLDWAGRIPTEIRYREAADASEEADHRAEQLTRWYSDDVQAVDADEVDAVASYD
jgi:hypothetical protein